jgi:predicted ribosomally synthesized peptide with SipW-like signal peptide
MADHRSGSARRPRDVRRVKAVLAGGLVLGLGAAITLAAWNDSEFATGTFSTGHFNVQGSADGTTFGDHTSSGSAAALSFSTGFNHVSPSDTVAAPFVLHLDKDTDYAATVSVNSAAASGSAAAQLTYKIVRVASLAGCTSSATGSATIVPAGTALASVAGASTFELTTSTNPGVDPGADVFLCTQVTASSALAQGTSAVGTWEFLASSHS